jgi:hypothetical protein
MYTFLFSRRSLAALLAAAVLVGALLFSAGLLIGLRLHLPATPAAAGLAAAGISGSSPAAGAATGPGAAATPAGGSPAEGAVPPGAGSAGSAESGPVAGSGPLASGAGSAGTEGGAGGAGNAASPWGAGLGAGNDAGKAGYAPSANGGAGDGWDAARAAAGGGAVPAGGWSWPAIPPPDGQVTPPPAPPAAWPAPPPPAPPSPAPAVPRREVEPQFSPAAPVQSGAAAREASPGQPARAAEEGSPAQADSSLAIEDNPADGNQGAAQVRTASVAAGAASAAAPAAGPRVLADPAAAGLSLDGGPMARPAPPAGEAPAAAGRGAEPAGEYSIQVAAFSVPANAQRLVASLAGKGYSPYLVELSSRLRAVRFGHFADRLAAARAATEFRRKEGLAALVER